MKSAVRNTIRRLFGAVLAAAPIISALPSCESIYDDLPPCDHGVSLRFVYDYNMEYADAFPSKVDCLTLLVYDADGRYVGTYTETGEALRREGYRMKLDLEPGVYRFVAYGGMACEKASFGFVQEPAEGSQMSDLRTALDADCLSDDDRRNLHPLYWGTLTLPTGDLYNEGVVRMMKDTNNIRIVLQQMSGDKVDVDDFDFEITDDNTLFGVDNLTIPCGEVLYRPWARGQTSMGITDGGREVVAAFAELSVSRLMTGNAPRLVVRRRADGRNIIDLPLNNCLMMLKSELYADMQPQEFLDRQSEWSVVFFLSGDMSWIKTVIKINDWTVRINDSEL